MKNYSRGALALSVLAVAALTLTGCATTTSGGSGKADHFKIGYIVKRGTDPFASDQVNAAKAQAEKDGNTLLTADVKQDSSLTISTVNQMIANGIQGLIIVVPDQTLGPQVLKLAKAAGIPVIASDDTISDAAGKAAPFVGLDGNALGTQAGSEIVKAIDKNTSASPSTAATVVFAIDTLSVCNERTKPAEKATAAGAGAKVKALHVPYDGTLASALTAMSTTITQNPNIKDWYLTGCNDDGVAGGLRALESVGVTKEHSFGFGMDGALACTELAKDNGFAGANYVSFKKNGEIAYTSMLAYLKDGTKIPVNQAVPGPIVTRDNKATVAGC